MKTNRWEFLERVCAHKWGRRGISRLERRRYRKMLQELYAFAPADWIPF
jgi:hypothetical protein